MHLKLLEIQGFKSFPDKTRLSFDKDISAVIGPNGSGKSNISDAIRWVLGEQSNKQLRGKKMEDVIFSGTALRKPLGFAEVTITLDNTDRGLNFDSDEVALTRRYYRSGESEYKINGAGVRLKDVNELFMDTGLGRDGYSMIGQGKISEIVGSKSDERRDIFEEAAGISKFRFRRGEAQNRLNKAEENLLRLRDILEELEGRVEPLKEQSQKAQEFLDISVEKKDLEIGLWLNTIEKSKDELREHDYKITVAKAQYEKLEKELTELEVDGEINARDIQSIAVQIDSIRRQSAKNDEQSSQTKSEIAVFENTILHNNETVDRLKKDIESANSSDDIINSEIDEKNAEIEKIQAVINEKQTMLDSKTEQLSSLSDNSGDVSNQIAQKNTLLNELSAKISENKVRKITAQNASEELSKNSDNFDTEREGLEKNVSEAEKELSALEADTARCDEQILECKNVINGFKMKLDSRVNKVNQKKEECDKIRLDIGEKERRIKILQDLERNMDGFNYAVKAVTKEVQHGTLRGIHGPVSRLINVPNEYSTAIETALGASAQNIIVSSEEDAKRAISFLKNSNSGRATFLPITSIKPIYLRENGVNECIGFVGTASDLITYDGKYKDIIASLLGRVVIAEDMDCAVAMAKKFGYRFRVVTLDGQVVNAGGSLTGGSHAKNAGLLNRATQIEKLQAEIKLYTKKLDDEQEEYKRLSADAAKMQADIDNASSELATANEDKIRLQGEYNLLSEQKKTASSALNTLCSQRESAKGRIEQYLKAVNDSVAQIAQLENQKNELERDIESLSGGQDKLAQRRNELSDSVSALRLDIIGFTKDIENIKNTIEQLELSKNDRSKRVSELNSEIEQIELKNQEIKKEIDELSLLNNGFLSASTDAAQSIERLNNRREELEKSSNAARIAEREKMDDREKISGELARLTERREIMDNEYNDIISRLFDEYELTLSAAQEIANIPDDVPAANKRLNELKRRIKALGSVNVAAIEEYKEVSERYEFMSAQMADIEKSKAELLKLIDDLTGTMRDMFTKRFEVIAENFTTVFKELFGGGNAQLKLTDPNDVLETGIEIIAQPPGKSISIIEQLSGGEMALIAMSIYFAIMKVNPPPFCLLDEVEAALDDVNVDRFAQYLRRMSVNTQFIVITHRRGTMEESDVLYGVTMQEKGVSKLLSIDVTQIEKTLETKVAK